MSDPRPRIVVTIGAELLLRLEQHVGSRNGARGAFIEDAIADALDAAEGIAGQRVGLRERPVLRVVAGNGVPA